MRSNSTATEQYRDLFMKEASAWSDFADMFSSAPAKKSVAEVFDLVQDGLLHGGKTNIPATFGKDTAAVLTKKIVDAVGDSDFDAYKDTLTNFVSQGVSPANAVELAAKSIVKPQSSMLRDVINNKGKIMAASAVSAGIPLLYALRSRELGRQQGIQEAGYDNNATRAAIAAGSALAGYTLPTVASGLFDSSGFGDSFDENYFRNLKSGRR